MTTGILIWLRINPLKQRKYSVKHAHKKNDVHFHGAFVFYFHWNCVTYFYLISGFIFCSNSVGIKFVLM